MKRQRGGTILGFIIGVVVGLGIALGVAVYVTKVPIPFMNKSQSRTAEQDAEEAKKNKDWDPNAPLYGKNALKSQGAASAPANAASDAASGPDATTAGAAPNTAATISAPVTKGDDKKPADKKVPDTKSADPLGDLAKAKAGASAPLEPFIYWVQVGAFRTAEDAESQRAKLSLGGIETKLSERDQSGHTVYRVRVGPFDTREDGDKAKEKLDKAGLETALVRVTR